MLLPKESRKIAEGMVDLGRELVIHIKWPLHLDGAIKLQQVTRIIKIKDLLLYSKKSFKVLIKRVYSRGKTLLT